MYKLIIASLIIMMVALAKAEDSSSALGTSANLAPLGLSGTILNQVTPNKIQINNRPVQQGNTKPTPPSASSVPEDVQKALNMPDGADRKTAMITAVKAWAQTNPVDAVNFGGHLKDPAQLRLVLETATAVWVENDEKAAGDWGLNHGTGMQQHFLFANFGRKHGVDAANWILRQPNHNVGEFAVIIESWCRNGGPDASSAAGDWILKQKLSSEDASGGIFFIAGSKAWKNPPDAADWIMKLPESWPRVVGAKVVVGNWSRRIPSDIPKIKDWINQLPLSNDQKNEVAKGIVVK